MVPVGSIHRERLRDLPLIEVMIDDLNAIMVRLEACVTDSTEENSANRTPR
jgi:hypothetical protein